jgi:hypothetical protein
VPLDPEKLAEVLITAAGVLFVGSSTLLVAVAIAWRLTLKPTMRALLEYRTARAGGDPVLARRLAELEEEFRALKDTIAALPEGNPTRPLGADVPWRGTKEKV